MPLPPPMSAPFSSSVPPLAGFSGVPPSVARTVGAGVVRIKGARRYQVADEVVVEANEAEYRVLEDVIIFRDGVHAIFGPTELFADTLVVRSARLAIVPPTLPTVPGALVYAEGRIEDEPTLDIDLGGQTVALATQEAYALGNVRIVDPEGDVQAENFRFRWKLGARRGTAERVSAEIGSVRLKAARAILTPEKYTLYDVEGTACRGNPPFLSARAPELTVIPGKRGTARRPQLSILGRRLPAVPSIGFSLDNRTQGIRLPSLTYRQSEGLGVSFGGNRLFGESAQGVFNYSAFPGQAPSYGASYNQTSLAPGESRAALSPVSDLDERFFFSWFQNIYAGVPESEVNYLRQKRANAGAASLFNVGATGRMRDSPLYSKAIEGILERGGPISEGPLAGGGYRAQLRASYFAEEGGTYSPRVSLTTNAAKLLGVRGRLTTVGRLDSNLVASKTLFGYAGGEIGVGYRANQNVRFGASAFAYAQAGDAPFTLDPLANPRGFSIRTDLNSAPTKFSLLLRYDERGRQFDREYRFSQVIGCLEPVIVYREFPRTYQVGLRFRIDDLIGALQKRDPNRGTARSNPYER